MAFLIEVLHWVTLSLILSSWVTLAALPDSDSPQPHTPQNTYTISTSPDLLNGVGVHSHDPSLYSLCYFNESCLPVFIDLHHYRGTWFQLL